MLVLVIIFKTKDPRSPSINISLVSTFKLFKGNLLKTNENYVA